ncbi:MAG: carbohydrate ABC transporter permease [Oscillospiraceae bacterium]|nr:carbohydrate ABC transporter permease [Clostridiales bacterium]MCI7575103.1 carbohydrate ABC transporter permease [Clostridiales bacterium]MDD7674270.1 carbohydrate ABC transporter permease [Oscillospiraceae bacterium]MDY5643034.1 carbohydrate ABC transporter permease [Candidatus Faecousia sp.]
MSKKKPVTDNDNMNRLNRITPTTNFLFNLMFLILALVCFLPIIFIFIISITKNEVLRTEGYKLFVTAETVSLDAYTFLWGQKHIILNALVISVKVTAIGTVLGVMLTCLMGYVLSRKEHKLNGFLTMLVFIPMVFGGGLASSYVVNTQILGLRDNLWVLILPLAVSSFNVTIARTFFRTTVPDSIIESAKIDGASQWTVFFRIVLPISKPVLATIALFLAFGYWNDWYQSMLYINDTSLKSLQATLDSMQKSLEYLTKNPSAGMTSADLKKAMPEEAVRMAIAFVVAVPIACVYPFFQKYFISGLTVGAVKG